MKWSKFFISFAFLVFGLNAVANTADSLSLAEVHATRYDQRIERYRRHWAALIPTQFIIQNAGNMGTLSAGIGWDYGKRNQWETDLLIGFIPKHQTDRLKITMTLKENYIPWSIALTCTDKSEYCRRYKGSWSFAPLTASLYLNTVFGHEFWQSQPGRYPDNYYQFMSTKFRWNFALGQRLTFHIPESKRRRNRSVSIFYEVSTCDLYLRSKIMGNGISWSDIFGLSLGVRFLTL